MLDKEINNLFEKNKLINFDNLLFKHETFEEVPLFNRYIDITPFFAFIKSEEINTFLFNLAYIHLSKLNIYARHNLSSKEFDNFFSCITYTDDDKDAIEYGFYVPRFFITRVQNKLQLKDSILSMSKLNLKHNDMIRQSLLDLGMIDKIDVYHEKWFDEISQDYIQRYYFFNKDKK